ncbi:MAG TPA: hypothetical protein VFV99_08850 [Kofleriaceae bacterium]|nr:hypothetical protein [Kofleriaceae bacterium]
MNAASKRVLHSLVPVICPPDAEPLADAIVEHMELTLAASGPMIGKAFDAGLLAYDLGAVARYGRRAHALTGDRAERYYQYWENTQFGRAINQIMSLACYEQPEMMRAVGFEPEPWIAEVTKKRLTVYADDVRKQDAQILAPDPLRPLRKKEVA